MTKILWDYIKAKRKHLKESNEDKKTVVVHSIDELEKETSKIKSKGDKK